MISFKLEGDLEGALDRYGAKVAEDLAYTGAAAMARVIYNEVQHNASGAKEGAGGPGVVTGTLASSIYWAKDKSASTAQHAEYDISWNKTTAPHGHLVEFGTARAPAYPFVRPALSRMSDAIRAGLSAMRRRLQRES